MKLIILVVAFVSTIVAVPIEQIENESSIVPDVIEKTTVKFEIEKVEDKSKFSEKDVVDKKVGEISEKVEIFEEKESIKKDVVETSTVRDFEEEPLTLYEEVKPEEIEDEEISLPNRIGTRIFIEKQQQQQQRPPPKQTGNQKIIICSPEKSKKKHGSSNDDEKLDDDDEDADEDDDEEEEPKKKSKKRNKNKNKDPAVIIRDDALIIRGNNPNIVKDERIHTLNRRPDIYYDDDYYNRPQISQISPNRRPEDRYDDIYQDFDRRRPPEHLTPHDDYYYDDIRRRPPPSGYVSDHRDNIRRKPRPPKPPAPPSPSTTAAPQVVVAKRPLVVLRPTHRPPVIGNSNSTIGNDADEVYELEHVYEVDDFRNIGDTIPNINNFPENIPDEETRLIKVEKSKGPDIIMVCEKKQKKSKEEKKREKEEKKKEKEKEQEQKVVVVYPSKPTIHISKRKPHFIEAKPVYIYQTYSGGERFPAGIVSNVPHELPILTSLTTDKILYPPNPYLHIPSISVQAGVTGNHPQSILQNVQENPSLTIPHLSAHVLLHSPGSIPNREHLGIPHIPHIPQFSYVQTQSGERRPDHLGISVLGDSIKPIISIGINKEVNLKEPENKGEIEKDHEKDIKEVKDKKDFEMVKDGKVEDLRPMDSSIVSSSEMKDVPMKKDEIIKEDMKEMMIDGMVMSDTKIKDEDNDKKVINSQMSGLVHLPVVL